MTLRSLLLTGAALLVASGTTGLHAQTVTPAQQAQLEAQLKTWFGTGPQATVAKVTPAGDHFDVVAPVRLPGPPGSAVQVTAVAKPGDNGKWTYTDVRMSTPFQMVTEMPALGKDGAKGPPGTIPVTYVVNAASQQGTVVVDPSFTSESSWNSAIKGLTIVGHGTGFDQTSTVEAVDSKTTVSTEKNGVVDVAMSGTLNGYSLDSKAGGDTPPIVMKVKSMALTGAFNRISRDQAGKMIRALVSIGEATKGQAGPGPKRIPPALLTAFTDSLQGLGSDMTLVETLDAVSMNVGGVAFGMDQVRLGLDGKSDNGMLQAGMDIGFKGLALPDMGLGELQALIPTEVSLHPFVSGLSVSDGAKLLTAFNQDRSPTPAEVNAMFSHGGIVTGFDRLSMDVGGAAFTAESRITATSPQVFGGTGRIVATNFDSLVQKLGAVPMAQQAMPAVIFLKGIGRTEGGKLVWDVNYTGGKLLVNNMDLSAMTGAAPGPGGAQKAPQRTR